MTVYNALKEPLAVTSIIVTGRSFVLGDRGEMISLRGYAMAAEDGLFLRALRDGHTYLIEDAGEHWHLHHVALSGPRGIMVEGEPVVVNKEGIAR